VALRLPAALPSTGLELATALAAASACSFSICCSTPSPRWLSRPSRPESTLESNGGEPMLTALIVSQVLSWGVILALVVAVLALARQVGVLHMRVAPAGR
jgi:hypothetical protein